MRARLPILVIPLIAGALAVQSASATTVHWSNSTLEPLFSLSSSPGPPAVAVDPHGNVIAAWSSATRGVLVATRVKNGAWSNRVHPSNGAIGDFVQVATGANGTAAVAWVTPASRYTPAKLVVAIRALTGAWPATPDVVAQYPVSQMKMGIDAYGTVTIVWTQNDTTGPRTMVSSHATGGSWSAALAISPAGINSNLPDLVVASTGAALAVWQESPIGSWNPVAVGAAFRPAASIWQPPQVVAAGAGAAMSNPKPGIDTVGDAAVGFLNGNTMTASRRSQSGAWSSPVALSPPTAYYPAFAMDAAGDMVAAWQSLDLSGNGRIIARSFSSGNWGAPKTLGPAANSADWPTAAYSSDGVVAVITWVDDTVQTARAALSTNGGPWTLSTLGGGGGWWGTQIPAAAGGGVAAAVRTATVPLRPDTGRMIGSTYGG